MSSPTDHRETKVLADVSFGDFIQRVDIKIKAHGKSVNFYKRAA